MSGYQFIGKATPTMQKQINTSLVYHYIYEHDLCHRAIIAKDLNLSAPAVSRAVETLLEHVAENYDVSSDMTDLLKDAFLESKKAIAYVSFQKETVASLEPQNL